MNIRAVTKCLSSLGWTTFADEVGEKCATYLLSDRVVQVIYGLRKYGSEQQLEVMRSVSTTGFSEACATIDPAYGEHAPLIRDRKGLCLRADEISDEHVRQACAETIEWAEDQDLGLALEHYAALPTNAPGARPIWHLAALATLARVEDLRRYQVSFGSGDRLGFVNYVTKDYIDRAVLIAGGSVAS